MQIDITTIEFEIPPECPFEDKASSFHELVGSLVADDDLYLDSRIAQFIKRVGKQLEERVRGGRCVLQLAAVHRAANFYLTVEGIDIGVAIHANVFVGVCEFAEDEVDAGGVVLLDQASLLEILNGRQREFEKVLEHIRGLREMFEEASVMLLSIERLKACVAALEYDLLRHASRGDGNELLTELLNSVHIMGIIR